MKRYWAFLVIILVFSSIHSPMATAQTDRPLSDYPIITAQNISQLKQLKVLGEGYIRDVIFSPDEQFVAMATSVGIWLYSADDLETPIRLFGDYAIDVTYAMFNADGTQLYGGIQGGSVYIWDVATGELLIAIEDTNQEDDTNRVTQINYADDEQKLYIMTENYLSVWDLNTQTLQKIIRIYEPNAFRSRFDITRLSPNNKYIVKFRANRDVRERDIYFIDNVQTTLIHIETEESFILDYAIFPNFDDTGNLILAEYSNTSAIGIWDAESGELLDAVGDFSIGYDSKEFSKNYTPQNVQRLHPYSQHPEVAFISSDQSKLIIIGEWTQVWDIDTNTLLHSFSIIKNIIIGDEPFNLFEPLSISYTTNVTELMQFINDEKIFYRIPLYFSDEDPAPYFLYFDERKYIQVSPLFSYFIILDSDYLRIWDVEKRELKIKFDLSERCNPIDAATFSLNHTRVIAYTNNSQGATHICIWDAETQELNHQILSNALRYYPYHAPILDNEHFLVVDRMGDGNLIAGTTQIWDIESLNFINVNQIEHGYGEVSVSSFSPDGKYLVTGEYLFNEIHIFDTETGDLVQFVDYPEDGIKQVRFSPDGNFVGFAFGPIMSSSAKAMVYVLNTQDFTVAYKIEGYERDAQLLFSPNSQYLLTTESYFSVATKLWDTTTGDLLFALTPTRLREPLATFNHDSTQLAIIENHLDGINQILEVPTGNEIYSLDFMSHYNVTNNKIYVSSLEFSPSENLLMVSITNDYNQRPDNHAVIQFWDTNIEELIYTMPTQSFYGGKFKFNDAGNLIIAEMGDGTIRIWGIDE
jgi:WD40 repeat protein